MNKVGTITSTPIQFFDDIFHRFLNDSRHASIWRHTGTRQIEGQLNPQIIAKKVNGKEKKLKWLPDVHVITPLVKICIVSEKLKGFMKAKTFIFILRMSRNYLIKLPIYNQFNKI